MSNIYLAGMWAPNLESTHAKGEWLTDQLAARVNCLESFYYIEDWETRLIPRFKRFMLDSGAFTFAFGGGAPKNIVWDEYADRYADYIKTNLVTDYLELDIDALVGHDKVLKIRNRIEAAVGRPCRPVWHLSRGKDEWIRLCDEYDRVAIGGIAVPDGRRRLEPYLPWFTREAHKRGTRVHGLGYTRISNLQAAGFDSVDSTAWLSGNLYGYVYQYDGHRMRKVKTGTGRRVKSMPTARHNFMQWVRMAERMENPA